MSYYNMQHAFNRNRIDLELEDLTTFYTRYGNYKYRVLLFGLYNGLATYQRLINDSFLEYLDDFVYIYVDDIIVYSNTLEEYIEYNKKVFKRLQEIGIYINIEKSLFYKQEVLYLGYIVSINGIRIDLKKIKAITDQTLPKTLKGLQSFVGFYNFYRKLIPNFSRLIRPLTKLFKSSKQRHLEAEEIEAFEALKRIVASSNIVAYYNLELESYVEIDASDDITTSILS